MRIRSDMLPDGRIVRPLLRECERLGVTARAGFHCLELSHEGKKAFITSEQIEDGQGVAFINTFVESSMKSTNTAPGTV